MNVARIDHRVEERAWFDQGAMATIVLIKPDWRTTTNLYVEISVQTLSSDILPPMRGALHQDACREIAIGYVIADVD